MTRKKKKNVNKCVQLVVVIIILIVYVLSAVICYCLRSCVFIFIQLLRSYALCIDLSVIYCCCCVWPPNLCPVFRCLVNASTVCTVYRCVVHCSRTSLSIVCRPHFFFLSYSFLSSSLCRRCNIVRFFFIWYCCCGCIVLYWIVSLTLNASIGHSRCISHTVSLIWLYWMCFMRLSLLFKTCGFSASLWFQFYNLFIILKFKNMILNI